MSSDISANNNPIIVVNAYLIVYNTNILPYTYIKGKTYFNKAYELIFLVSGLYSDAYTII